MEEGLKIIKAEINNFKNIDHKVINFEGRSALIIGANNKSKSSLIQAVCSPVNANFIPQEPIKEGEERAEVELELAGTVDGEYLKYTIGMYFSEQHKKGRLGIVKGDGEKVKGGRGVVDGIVGRIGFDMMQFLRMGKTATGKVSKQGVRDQIEILKDLLPAEIKEALFKIDQERQTEYSTRADVNKEIEIKKATLEGHGYTQEDIEKYSQPKDTKGIEDKINNITTEIQEHDKIENVILDLRKAVNGDPEDPEYISLPQEIENLEKELKEKKELLEKSKTKLKNGEEWLEKNPKPTIGTLTTELQTANEHNAHHAAVKALEESQKEITDKQAVADKHTEKLEELDTKKKELFASNPLPVKDLTFDEDQIYYKGLPFTEDQHSTSILMGIGIRIGMAMNPNLKLLVIQDGSLLDKKTLKFILKICNDEGYQVLIEMVDPEGESDMTIEFTEVDQ